jgi:NitT/TauT family transport system substrate-binding protein
MPARSFRTEREDNDMSDKRLAGVVATALLAGALSAFAAPAAMAQTKMQHITIAPMTPSPVAWTAYFIAKPLGYYAAENLEVDIIKNPPRGSLMSMLLTGQVLFGGMSSVNNMPKGATLGKLKWFVNHEMFPFKIMVMDSSPIKDVKELRGKTLGMRSANDEPAAKLLMAGGDVNQGDFKTLVVGPGVPGGAALKRGAAQAIIGTVVDQMEIEASGVKLRAIDLGRANGMYNGGTMATTDELSKNRDLAVRFGRALTKGYIWANENPDASLDLLAKVVPEAVQNRETTKKLLIALNNNNRPRYDARFRVDPDVYQRQIDLEAKVGILDKSFSAKEVYTDDLLKDIWNFDVDAVKKQAKAGKY